MEFPGKAIEFLEGVLRAQIDRITPWTPSQAAYGHSAPTQAGADRIRIVMAATPLSLLERYTAAFGAAEVNSIVVLARRPPEDDGAPILVQERAFQRDQTQNEARRGLAAGIVGALAFAGLAVALSGALGAYFDSQAEQVAGETRQWRQSQMAGTQDPAVLLHRRKLETPLAVLVLDQLARILPDDTYLKDLQISDGKVEIGGVSRDATRLSRLIENSPTFARAAFSGPTTHSPNEPGDQFHIQAQLRARYPQGE